MSEPAAVDLGLQNHLFLQTTAGGDSRLIASGKFGAYSFVQTPNLAPYLSPTNVCQPGFFATHWGKELQGALSYFDPDGDAGRDGFAGVSYLAPPGKGYDLLTTQASDGVDVSPLALSTILLTNQAPTVSAISIGVTAGTTYTGSVPATDTDFDPLTFQVVQPPSVGTVSIDGTGIFTFSAPSSASGTTTFTVRAFDQVDYSTPTTITVQFVAPPPNGGSSSGGSSGGSSGASSNGGGGGGELGGLELAALFMLSGLRVFRRGGSRRPAEQPAGASG